jgi:hypothetical protein
MDRRDPTVQPILLSRQRAPSQLHPLVTKVSRLSGNLFGKSSAIIRVCHQIA